MTEPLGPLGFLAQAAVAVRTQKSDGARLIRELPSRLLAALPVAAVALAWAQPAAAQGAEGVSPSTESPPAAASAGSEATGTSQETPKSGAENGQAGKPEPNSTPAEPVPAPGSESAGEVAPGSTPASDSAAGAAVGAAATTWQVVDEEVPKAGGEETSASAASSAPPCPPAAPAEETTEPAPAPKKSPEGFYFGGALSMAFALKPSHEWSQTCPVIDLGTELWAPSCQGVTPIGGALEGVIGYRHGPIAVEGYALGAADYSSAQLVGDPSLALPDYATSHYVGRAGGGLGMGPRIFVPLGPVTFTGAVGAGFMARAVFTNVSSLDGSSQVYVVPATRFSAAVRFLGVFQVGVLGWVEFLDSVEVTPDLSTLGVGATFLDQLGSVTVFQGPQFFIGPFAGMIFGGT